MNWKGPESFSEGEGPFLFVILSAKWRRRRLGEEHSMSSTNGGKKPMNKRATDCIAYLTPLGTVLALIFGDRAAC